MNPFRLTVLPLDAPFCDRREELAKLAGYAATSANVLVDPLFELWLRDHLRA